MLDKYYTPTIEEFHVGFEYERCDDGYSYFKDTFPRAINLELFFKHPERFLPYMRVKCLDENDFIECGGVKVDDRYTFKDFNLSINEDGSINVFRHYDLGNGIDVKIRNKSELKSLIKQLCTC